MIRFARYAVLGLWISLGAPWVFGKLRLARHPPPGRAMARTG